MNAFVDAHCRQELIVDATQSSGEISSVVESEKHQNDKEKNKSTDDRKRPKLKKKSKSQR